MIFTEMSVPLNLRNKPLVIRQFFAQEANACIKKGMTSSQAIAAATKKTLEYEAKVTPQVKPKTVNLVESIKKNVLASPLFPEKPAAVEPEIIDEGDSPKILRTEFDKQGRLVIYLADGSKVISRNVAPAENIQQSVAVQVNPVFDYVLFNTTANLTDEDFLPGMLTWNEPEDCLNVVQNDGTILQVGLENYIEVRNRTGSNLANGTVVRFSGVNGDELPMVAPMLGDGSLEPLYIVGVITDDIADGDRGRATILGKVRDVDTTGASVGEVWQQGDLLWVSPTQAGKLTKVRPTAPNINISVAAVLKVGATDGMLLVRPTIFPRLFYGKFMSTQNQTPAAINTAYPVTFNSTEIASGVSLQNNSEIVLANSGLYSFDFRLQITSTNANTKNLWIWARKNLQDIPSSATKVSVTGNAVEIIPSWDFVYSMTAGDRFQLMYAVDDTGLLINAPAATAFAPATPSAKLSVKQVNL